jgi:uncharacterized membrane protein
MTSIATGGIGVILATGTISVGIEIIPGVIGLVKIFIGHHQVIAMMGEDRTIKGSEVMGEFVTRGPEVSQVL